MPAKRAAAKAERQPEVEPALTKAEACKILQIAPTADEELVLKAYWHWAGKYRAFAKRDPRARAKLDELNRAYLALNPTKGEAPLTGETPPAPPVDLPPPASPWVDSFFAGVRRILHETSARWPGRMFEMGVLAATIAILAYLALEAGAAAIATLITAAVAAVTIWAPWRRI